MYSTLLWFPKIHKPNIPIRPIISAGGSLTDQLLNYVTHFIQLLVKRFPSYIEDSKHFLQLLEPLLEFVQPLPEKAILVTAEVASLYTNIPHEGGIESALDFIKLHASTLTPGTLSCHTEYYLKPSWRTTIFHSWTAFSPNCQHSHGNQGYPTICQALHGLPISSLLVEIHRWHFPDLPRHHQTTPILKGFHEQPPQIHFWTLHPRDILPRLEDPHRSRLQALNNLVQKTHWLCRTSTLLL